MAKNILITGANGQLGFAIYNKLYKYFNVIPTSFSKNSNSLLNFKQLDITNVDFVLENDVYESIKDSTMIVYQNGMHHKVL